MSEPCACECGDGVQNPLKHDHHCAYRNTTPVAVSLRPRAALDEEIESYKRYQRYEHNKREALDEEAAYLRARVAELEKERDAMRGVVRAAEAWRDTKWSRYSKGGVALDEAVDAYRAQLGGGWCATLDNRCRA